MRTMLLIAGAVCSVACMAQATITPTLKEGLQKNYYSENRMNVVMTTVGNTSMDIDYSNETSLAVKKVDGDTAVIELTIKNVKNLSNGKATAGGINAADYLKAMEGYTTLMSVNKDGSFRNILNLNEIKENMKKAFGSKLAGTPMEGAMDNLLSSDELKKQYEQTLGGMLYGKKANSTSTEETKMNGIKIKQTVTVSADGKHVDIVAVPSMEEEDFKQMMKDQMEAMGTEDADSNLDQAWGMMKAMGLLDATGKINTSIDYGDDGWMKSYTSEGKLNCMGAKNTIKSTTKLK